MGDEFVDILHHLIKFDDDNINFIIDKKGNTWFNVRDILKMLEIKDPKKTIKRDILKENKIRILDIDESYREIFPGLQPNTIFINEFGMYELILRSRMNKAKKFRKLLTTKILPLIRQFGFYSVDDKNKQKLLQMNEKMRDKMKELKDRIKVLENNMKKDKYPTTGVVYAVRPQHVDKKLIKVGKSGNLKTRMQVINNSLPDHADVLYYIETNEIDKLERIIKDVLVGYVYIHRKEYYKISVPKMRIIYDKCYEFMNEINKPKTEKQKISRLNGMIQLKENIKKEFERQGLIDDNNDNNDINEDYNMEGGHENDSDSEVNYDINDPMIYLYQEDIELDDEIELEEIIQQGGYELPYLIYKEKYYELEFDLS